jgi:hypothetical protein
MRSSIRDTHRASRIAPAFLASLATFAVVGLAAPGEDSADESAGIDAPRASASASDAGLPWAFLPIARPELPELLSSDGAAHPIDRFIEARLARAGLEAAPEADAQRLLRRLWLDLTGLVPSPEEADAFERDDRPDAYERAVDRALASPAFGERMAQDWLDVARYADSNGYQGDGERTMWPWRDWVAAAFNRNQPLDEFTIWQIAGDLVEEASPESRLATGFLRSHAINGEGGRIPEENRVDYVFDMTETVGTAWLGLTFNCTRCHDHKFDPLTRRDYYSLSSFFNQTPVDGGGGSPQTPPVITVASDEQREELERLDKERSRIAAFLAAEEPSFAAELIALAAPSDGVASDGKVTDDAKALAAALSKPIAARRADDWKKIEAALSPRRPDYASGAREIRESIERRDAIERSLPRVMVMEDRPERRPTYILEKGLYSRQGDEVDFAVPASLPGLDAGAPRNRLGLARWLVDPRHPLTARVVANQWWQRFFGIGLVKTAEDFGSKGEPPSHPELLDWLASELIESGWNTKAFSRLIVTSAAYRRSARVSPRALEIDPENRLLARGARFRLPSWMLRDRALQASGLLIDQLGGPPVFSYQPAGVWEDATFGNKRYPEARGASLYRRSIYSFWRRIVAPTVFFDTASRQVCTVKPTRTNSPLHALTTLNDVTYFEAARVLAARVLRELPEATDRARIERVFRLVLVRPPSAAELDVLEESWTERRGEFSEDPDSARALLAVGDSPASSAADLAGLAALACVANVVFNLDEALTKE